MSFLCPPVINLIKVQVCNKFIYMQDTVYLFGYCKQVANRTGNVFNVPVAHVFKV